MRWKMKVMVAPFLYNFLLRSRFPSVGQMDFLAKGKRNCEKNRNVLCYMTAVKYIDNDYNHDY